MTSPSFTTTTYLSRGRMEREIEVEVDYTFDGVELVVTECRDLTEGCELSDEEWECATDAANADCEAAYSDWLQDNVLCDHLMSQPIPDARWMAQAGVR